MFTSKSRLSLLSTSAYYVWVLFLRPSRNGRLSNLGSFRPQVCSLTTFIFNSEFVRCLNLGARSVPFSTKEVLMSTKSTTPNRIVRASNEVPSAIRVFEKKNKAAAKAFKEACNKLDARIDDLFGEDQEWRQIDHQEEKVMQMLKGSELRCGFQVPREDQDAEDVTLYPFVMGMRMFSEEKAPRRNLAQLRSNGLAFNGSTHAHLFVDEDIALAAWLAKMTPPTKADGRKSSASLVLRNHTEALKAATKEVMAILSFLTNVETYSTFRKLVPAGVSQRTGKPYDAFRGSRDGAAKAIEDAILLGEDVPKMSFKSNERPDPTQHGVFGPYPVKKLVADEDALPSDQWMHNPATGRYERTQVVETPYVHEADEARRDNREVREMAKRHKVANDLAARILDASE